MTYDNSEYTRPYSTPTARVFNYRMPHGKQGRLVIAAAIVAALGLVTAAVTLAMFLTYKGSAQNQISQMRNQLASAVQELQAVQDRQNVESANYSGLSGKVSNLGAAMGTWNLTCAQALESQNGPGTYYFPCSDTKP